MRYSEVITYDEPYFRYDGVKVVSPETIGLSNNFGDAKLLAAFIIHPDAIDSTLVFVDTSKIIVQTGSEVITTTTGTMEFFDPTAEGFMVFSVESDSAFALSEAETIVLAPVSDGSVDVTIL